MRSTLFVLLVAVLAATPVVAATCVASAQPAASGVDPARQAFEEGRDHFEDHRYLLAADAFRRAYDLMTQAGTPNAWMILYNLGTSLDEIPGREQDARDAYAGYLERATVDDAESAQRVALVQTRIRELDLRIAASASRERQEPAPAPALPTEPETTLSPIGPIVLGAAGALLVAAGVAAVIVAVENDSLLAACAGGVCPTSERGRAQGVQDIAIATDVLWISGAAVAATGLVLTLLLRDTVTEAPPVAAGCTGSGCSIALRVEI